MVTMILSYVRTFRCSVCDLQYLIGILTWLVVLIGILTWLVVLIGILTLAITWLVVLIQILMWLTVKNTTFYNCMQLQGFPTDSHTFPIPAPIVSMGAGMGVVPSFVGQNYFCESGLTQVGSLRHGYFWPDGDPLWDGRGCGPTSSCCTFNSPPWFNVTLPSPTTDNIEVRICSNEGSQSDDSPIQLIELYVKWIEQDQHCELECVASVIVAVFPPDCTNPYTYIIWLILYFNDDIFDVLFFWFSSLEIKTLFWRFSGHLCKQQEQSPLLIQIKC